MRGDVCGSWDGMLMGGSVSAGSGQVAVTCRRLVEGWGGVGCVGVDHYNAWG